MYTALVVLQVLVSLALIAFVLLQQGKGADAGAAFGAGASGTVFGSRGSANFFSRATAVCAALFMGISLALAYLVQDAVDAGGGSVVEQMDGQPAAGEAGAGESPAAVPAPEEQQAPEAPAIPE
ncbi:preprotein translocase subunit SecG [Algiphilus sp.]|uniref:preprotein translocase subunit SecG n=1 Tax=Algiphilus sp. TaxID=1872431 RepID=UPI0025C5EF2A|nr:preprotein translocase subunit SecG [Algiphilus sp.]MCK5769458.1 preprotein translocase subunit SecG [Algiphilus sp.]